MYKGSSRTNLQNTSHVFFKGIRQKMRCISAVLIRCITPFDENMQRLSKEKHDYIRPILCILLGFLLTISRLGQGICPFGISIVCAPTGKMCLFYYIGALVGSPAFGIDGVIQLITLSVVFLIRRTISDASFDEKRPIRITITAICSLFLGACFTFIEGFSVKSVFTYICFSIISVCAAYLFSICFEKEAASKADGLGVLSVFAFCVCLIPAFNRLSFSGIDLGLMAASIITMQICREKGPVFGCAAGFIMGFACQNPLFSVCIGMGGLAAGYLFSKSKVSAFISFNITCLFCDLYLYGGSSLASIMPFTIIATLIYSAFYNRIHGIFPRCSVKAKASDGTKHISGKNEFDKVSDSLSGLSSLIYKFAEHMKAPSKAETGAVFDKAFCEVCDSCSMSEMCYAKRECNFSSVRSTVISTLQTGILSESRLSALLLNKCIKVKEICEFINSRYSELSFFAMRSNRTSTVASIYSSMSRLIKSTSKSKFDNEARDGRLERTLGNALSKIGIEYSQIQVFGARNKQISIYGIAAEKIPCSAKDLAEYLSLECKISLTDPCFDISESANLIMKLSRKIIVKTEYACLSEAKDKGSINGDTIQFFEDDDGKFYCLIADGMGSGKTAAATSRLSCIFLEKMLRSGASKNVCLEMLNSLLLSKNDETFSGIDILEIDKICACANFIKAGAAVSFVLRKGKLYKISSQTPPVGIISTFSAESTRFNLENGDCIIMVSDGVISGEDDGIWLSELIHMDKDCEPAYLASRLIERAKSINKLQDDATACVIKVEV